MSAALSRCLRSIAAIAMLTAALVGCAAEQAPTVRRTPNAVELAAVQRTSQAFLVDTGDARLPWVQLWTSAQFPKQMQNCAAAESHGQLRVTVNTPELAFPTYGIVGSGSEPNEAEASRIIARCAAATPLDDRVLRLRENRWDALYSYEITTLRPCLLAHGYPVGAMPDRGAFTLLLRVGTPFSPYDAVVVPTRAAWYAVADACPPLPATLNSAVSHG